MDTEIAIDLRWLAELEITPDDFVYLYCRHKEVKLTKKLKVRPRVTTLQSKGLCKMTPEGVVVRQKFKDLIETDFDQQFAELLSTYPMKVGSPGNYRTLHAADPRAKANDVSRRRYKKVLEKDPTLHRKIMTLLQVQLDMQRSKLQFLQALEVWINARTWERWEGMDKEETSDGRITTEL